MNYSYTAQQLKTLKLKYFGAVPNKYAPTTDRVKYYNESVENVDISPTIKLSKQFFSLDDLRTEEGDAVLEVARDIMLYLIEDGAIYLSALLKFSDKTNSFDVPDWYTKRFSKAAKYVVEGFFPCGARMPEGEKVGMEGIIMKLLTLYDAAYIPAAITMIRAILFADEHTSDITYSHKALNEFTAVYNAIQLGGE